MDFYLIAQLVVYGIVLGAAYGLIAVGLTLVFGVLDVLNAAHGTYYMVGGYIAYYCIVALGMPYLPALIPVALGGIAIGILSERLAVARVRDNHKAALIATFSFAVLVESITTVLIGNTPQEVPSPFNTQIVSLAGIFINHQRLLLLGAAILIFVLIHLFITRSSMGLAMRAVARDMDTAALMGINIRAVYLFTFGMSGMLAALAGAFLAPLFSIQPTAWVFALLKAFVVVILGGMGSIYGAMVGGLLLGVTESFGAAMASGFKDGVGLAVLILFLLFRPQGLFGRRP